MAIFGKGKKDKEEQPAPEPEEVQGPLGSQETDAAPDSVDTAEEGETKAAEEEVSVDSYLESALTLDDVEAESTEGEAEGEEATEEDDDEGEEDDDLMAIFTSDEAQDEEMAALTKNLEDVDIGSLVTQARTLSGHLAAKLGK